ncbi:TRAP transporter small permease subunit [Halomonas janggokensis]|jgi:TRAP-type C4-dicarboxylate transport system permease small subunit|uniref:TRAP transporter small permease protein n=1 Tax=Vreelandella janggokensis TaxID=370767 RepID=A0ABT4IX00_9GAMM|nr:MULTISPECIES: TRAP transporter small permease subunit [Halomonas]MCZ0927499.1 TRAP transporter small permease subunit [Halomonas janggokensis]MCZ0930007.1 TRAP transporter small permease subunit [Halomonas janggokensis]QPL46083.1 TRAP transporter small permease [Halomonas sp. A40-4]
MQSILSRASHWLALFCRLVAGVALISLLAVTIADVSTRYLSKLTEGAIAFRVSGSVELVSYLMLFSLLAAMAANVEKSQVVVEAFSHGLPAPLKTRLHGVYLLGFAALGVVLFFGLLDSAASAARHGEVTQDLRIPMGPVYYLAAFLSILLGIRSAIHALLGMLFGVEEEVAHGE